MSANAPAIRAAYLPEPARRYRLEALTGLARTLDAMLNEMWTEIADLEEENEKAGQPRVNRLLSERRIEMPRGDGTGPMGMGPMTGRGAGYCAGYPVPGFMNPGAGGWGRGFGRGMGRGWGRGMGWRGGWGAWAGSGAAPYPVVPFAPGPVAAKDEAKMLRNQAAGIQQALDEINARLAEIEKADSTRED